MTKNMYKKFIEEAVEKKAFLDLKKQKEGRISENAKGKKIQYTGLTMAPYLSANEENMSIEEEKKAL